MPLLAAGHKRTGACPTFERPVLQRDGHLVRVPLVGGAMSASQARAIAQAAEAHGSGTIELTNRGNLQVRGVRDDDLAAVLAQLRDVGLGHRHAAVVTVSPFAAPVEHQFRHDLLAALDDLLVDGPALAPKFTVHVDDADGGTAHRRAEAVLTPADSGWRVRVAPLGEQEVTAEEALALVVALADACRSEGAHARVADLVTVSGVEAVRAALPLPVRSWAPIEPLAASLSGPLGASPAPGGARTAFGGARLGRIGPDVLTGLADLVDARPGAELRVTPWRSFAVVVPDDGGRSVHDAVHELAALGLIVGTDDPAADVVACTGAAGCWQTEVDTLAEAERQIARRSSGGSSLHVTGCDKRCATRSPVACTLVGRPDGSGFDEVAAS
ncbi:hypothetical protein ACE2AJ_08895 [Aquihabitans daechungensis]|uniref:hypothetical protein n=1 Tax=Aquihabitans daechungensis TaxID=1052257 RepID=UPI003B9E6774